MELDRWNALMEGLRGAYVASFGLLTNQFPRFVEFVDKLPDAERIPALLYAYDRYRDLNRRCDVHSTNRFESSCYSILISTILSRNVRPN